VIPVADSTNREKIKLEIGFMEEIKRFCIFKQSSEGVVPVQRDDFGFPITYSTREQAEREVATSVVSRIMQHFNQPAGTAEPDILTVRDYIQEVTVSENGEIVDRDGNRYGKED
jgi:hypothetical protein